MKFKILDKINLKTGILVVLSGAFGKLNANDVLFDSNGNEWLICGQKHPNIEQYQNGNQAFLIRNNTLKTLSGDFLSLDSLPNFTC